jgi:autotransporter-associated beta strand protein
VINLGGGGNETYTFDQSGSGLLKFTSAFTITDNRGPKTIILQGSTAGKGEIANVILLGQLANPNRLTKSGTGTWTLSAANLYAGVTTLNGGCLVLNDANALPGGIGTSGGVSALTFNGGVLGLGAGDFFRTNGAAGTVSAVNFTGNGGWAAYGADRVVNLGGASAPITWATANTGFNAKTLILGANTATHTIDFQNPLDLGNAARTVQTDNGNAIIDGKLSGAITGIAGGNLNKTGLGTLALTGTNNYVGTTTVSAGTLLVNGANSGTGLITVNNGATFGGTGSIAGAVTFSAGATNVCTVTRDPITEANATPITITGVMTYNSNEVHLNLPANFPSGVYTLASSSATPSGSVVATPVVDSGSYAAGFTSAAITLDTVNKKLLLTVNGLPTYPTQLAITSVNGGASPSAGVPFSVVVQAQDANGLVRSVLADTAVTLSVKTGTGSLGGTVSGTILAGSNSVTISGVTYSKDESGVVLTATRTSGDTLTAGDSAPFTVLPDTTPVALDITGFPSPHTSGVAGTVTVTAKTASGATATIYAGTVHFTSSAVAAGLPSDYTFVPGDNGVHLFTGVTLNTAGTQSITVTDTVTSSLTDTQSGIIVTPAAATTLIVSGFPSPQGTGVPGSVTVTAKDVYGNTDTNYTGTIHFTSSDGTAVLPGNYTFVSGDMGIHTFIDGVILNALGLQSITATDTVTGSITGTQSNITVWILPTAFSWTNTVSGSWSTVGNWSNNMGVVCGPAAAGQPDYTLTFNAGTYTATHNLNNGFLLNQIQFAGSVTIAGTSGMVLTNNGAVPPQVNQNSASSVLVIAPITLAGNATVGGAGNGQVEIFGSISGSGGLTKTNSGTLVLSSTSGNSYSGGTTVNKGALNLAQVNSVFGTGPVTVNPGATLNLSGNGNITNSFLLTGATVNNGNSFSAGLNGPITLEGTNTFDLGTAGNMSIGGSISGSGGLTKLGTSGGPLYLYATNTFTGTTTINAGSIQIGAAGQLASQMIVVNAGTLKLSNSSSLAEMVSVTIADGGVAKIDIPNGVTQTINMLYLGSDGKPEWIGTWGHSSSDATNKDDVHFTATSGKLRVLAGLQRGMVITLH